MFQTNKRKEASEAKSKIWYIIVDNHQEGPFSLLDLKDDARFNPDTLVWKKGFSEWVAARHVPELDAAFEDEPEPEPLHQKPKLAPLNQDLGQEQATLIMQQDPYQFILWLLVFLLVIVYALYQLYN